MNKRIDIENGPWSSRRPWRDSSADVSLLWYRHKAIYFTSVNRLRSPRSQMQPVRNGGSGRDSS